MCHHFSARDYVNAPPPLESSHFLIIIPLFTNTQIKYEPQNNCSAPITLFRAESVDSQQQNSSTQSLEATWGWNQLSDAQVEIHTVPGNHHSMLNEPHVKVLAEKLQQSLEQARNNQH